MIPSSSPGIEPISPPPIALSSSRQNYSIPRRNPLPNPSTGKQLSKLYREQSKSGRLKDKKQQSTKEENLKKRKAEFFDSRREKKSRSEGIEDGNVGEVEGSEDRVEPRARITDRMLKTLGRQGNPITNSDLPSRLVKFSSHCFGLADCMTCVSPEPIMWYLVQLDTKGASREGKMLHGLMLKYEPTNFKNKLEKRCVML